jgi:two-component system, NtrC family, response regulator AtoC
MPKIKPTILIVDDEASVRKAITIILRKKFNTLTASTGEEAIAKIKNENIDMLLLDLRLPDMNGLDILNAAKKINENIMVVIITAIKDTKTAVEAMKLGAYDYITKPFNVPELRSLVDKALEKLALIKENISLRAATEDISFGEMIGKSKKAQDIFSLIETAAKSDCTVLVTGESGTGKELITRAIHARSERNNKPFIVVNCAAIPDNLLEAELFGYERGSFTGAQERKNGKFELANGGTLFLDEIGTMSMHLQAKILRVLQESKEGFKEIERLGSSKSIPVDVRIIAATNIDLKSAIKEKRFRDDLFYRLNVFPIAIPALRERIEDTILLIDHFIDKFSRKLNKSKIAISDDTIKRMSAYNWPGNIRELENLIERLVTLNKSGKIGVEDLPLEMLIDSNNRKLKTVNQDIDLKKATEQLETQYIKRALQATNGNQVKAADILGIHRNTLFAKIKQLNIFD